MGNLVMSTFLMFVPQRTLYVFLTICCAGFFGIYIPYNESKKRGEIWGPLRWLKKVTDRVKSVRPGKSSEDSHVSTGAGRSHQLEQLETMRQAGLISGPEYHQKRDKILKGL